MQKWSVYKSRTLETAGLLFFVRKDRAWLRLCDATAGRFPPQYNLEAAGLRLTGCAVEDCKALDAMWNAYYEGK
jgi:hypothetical protein